MRLMGHLALSLACVLVTYRTAAGQETPTPTKRQTPPVIMGLEDLMKIEVTSVSKRPEALLDAATSVYVITSEEIRRSGATTLPEVLRLAPNLEVAQVSASGYAISARGFNNTAANKLLVLIDGRSIYTPLFGGVFWDAQDVLLEDVERIEIISGPGSTLWGVNAVNGVINVITRSAKDTQGTIAAGEAGNRKSEALLRYGDTLGDRGNYRIFGKYFDVSHTSTANGTAKADAWHQGHIGFRADWGGFTILGNAYKGTNGQPLPGTISISGLNLALGAIPVSGENIAGRWKIVTGGGSSLNVQAYYDRTERTVPPTFAEKLTIADFQFEHSIRPVGHHSLTWGGEYRYGMDRLVNSRYFAFLPANVNQKWTSVFAQDEIALATGLRLTLGTRVEHNDYTGTELLPNARLGWRVDANNLLWTAASRAVRAPSRLDRDAFVPGQPPFLLAGGPNVRSEIANVYEMGYRGQYATSITYSATVFRAVYDHLRTQELAPSRTFFFFANGMEGTTSGIELWVDYQASPAWRLSGGLNTLQEKLRLRPGSVDLTTINAQEGLDPAQSWRLRSSIDLPHHIEFDITARRVSKLSNPVVPGYTAADFRLGWRLPQAVDVSLAAQNLLGHHSEFTAASTRTEFGRGVFLRVSKRFDGND